MAMLMLAATAGFTMIMTTRPLMPNFVHIRLRTDGPFEVEVDSGS